MSFSRAGMTATSKISSAADATNGVSSNGYNHLTSRRVDVAANQLAPLRDLFTDSAYTRMIAARRAAEIDPSLPKPHVVCDATFGNPHEITHKNFVDTLQKHAVPKDEMWFGYKGGLEHPRSRIACAEKLQQLCAPYPGSEGEVQWSKDDVILTTGAVSGLQACDTVLCNADSEIIYLSPSWFAYGAQTVTAGGTPVRVPLPEPDFRLDVDAIEAVITPKTVAVIINTPHNPSGRINSAEELTALAEMLRRASEHNGRPIFIISDEAYRDIRFDGAEFHSPATFYEHTLIVFTFGKSLLTPGARIGYIGVSPAMPKGLREVLLHKLGTALTMTWSYPNNLMAYALPELQAEMPGLDLDNLQARRDLVCGELKAAGYQVLEPQGTFYVMVKSPIEDDVLFCNYLGEQHGIFVLAGKAFHLHGWFRICLTERLERFEEALPGFRAAFDAAKSGKVAENATAYDRELQTELVA